MLNGFQRNLRKNFQRAIVVGDLIVTDVKTYTKCEAFSPSWLGSIEVDKLHHLNPCVFHLN